MDSGNESAAMTVSWAKAMRARFNLGSGLIVDFIMVGHGGDKGVEPNPLIVECSPRTIRAWKLYTSEPCARFLHPWILEATIPEGHHLR